MANTNLGIRFTEETYATKNEVIKTLNIHVIDTIWSQILAYRSQFNRYLVLRTIENNRITFCYCPTILDNLNSTNMRYIKMVRDFTRFSISPDDHALLRNFYFTKSLKPLAEKLGVESSNEYLGSLIRGDLKDLNASAKIVYNYEQALEYIEKRYVNRIDENFLADLYSKILGVEELVTFYRTKEDNNPENKVLIDRIYTAAPVKMIELLMNNLFDFIANSNLGAGLKALITYYYVNYVKPFPKFNDEIAVLLAKSVLANTDMGEYGAFIPLERFLSQDIEKIAHILTEVQKTGDVTYFVNYGIKVLNEIAEEIANDIVNFHATELKNDFYKADEPVEEQPKEVQKAKAETANETTNVVKTSHTAIKDEEIAVSYIPPAIDEKEACRLEEHLLELDPSLKRGEARFYSRHCTLGKKYTIAQCKKCLGCAYETARTSMDHLAELGYYRKEMVKNKHVYTPISRK